MTDKPKRHTRDQLEQLLDDALARVESLTKRLQTVEASLLHEVTEKHNRARRASYGNGARQ